MAILYFDIVGGIAGDMTVAALLDLGVPLEKLRQGLAALGVEGIAIATERDARHSIAGTRFVVKNSAAEVHPHRPYREIRSLLERSALAPGARELALRIFAKLAEAEGAAHGISVDDVELHEVGAWDSIADVVCAAIALDHLRPNAIYCSPVPLGAGTVKTAHGTMPVPGPATLALLKGFPVETGGPRYERTTPTGAAILAAVARPAPAPFRFTPERIGIGLGTFDPPEIPNLLRAVLGSLDASMPAEAEPGAITRETIEVAEANLDDSNPQWIGYLMERLFAAGALDVALIPIHMKKNRPGTLVQALYPPELRSEIETVFFTESTTLGVRYRQMERAALPREATMIPTAYGDVAGKLAITPSGVRFAPEYDSCRAIAEKKGIPLQEVYRAALESWTRRDD